MTNPLTPPELFAPTRATAETDEQKNKQTNKTDEKTNNEHKFRLTPEQRQNLRLGYCCLNTQLRECDIFASRTCRLDTIGKKGIDYLYSLAHENLEDLKKIMEWNFANGIFLYRMSSEMFPFASHPQFYKTYDWEQFSVPLAQIGELSKKYNQRLTFHPGQYNQLTSARADVVDKAIVDLDVHAKIMDMIGVDHQGVIIIHGGTKNPSKQVALERLYINFKRLSSSAQKRLVLENCELAYSIEDLLPISEDLGIPIVIDYHHHNINPGTRDIYELTEKVVAIWKRRDIIPLFHVSESRPDVKPTDSITARRAHSDYVTTLPPALIQLIKTERIDIDVEAKMKELAVQRLQQLYFGITLQKQNTKPQI